MARVRSWSKPIGIISNSPGPLGGVNAAKSLQNILPGITGPIMGQPETYLTMVGDAFNDKGELVKESLQKVLEQFSRRSRRASRSRTGD